MSKIHQPVPNLERNDVWLAGRLADLWQTYFDDVEEVNPVVIKFGRSAILRLGSIRLDPVSKQSHITITSLFRDSSVPQEVVDHTIAHEMVHYAHGFSSLHKKAYKHPHKGGVVNKEIIKRGGEYLILAYKSWLKDYRQQLYKARYGIVRPRRVRRVRHVRFPFITLKIKR
jgi:hypothetical protein